MINEKMKESLSKIDIKAIPKKMSAAGVVNISPEPIIKDKAPTKK